MSAAQWGHRALPVSPLGNRTKKENLSSCLERGRSNCRTGNTKRGKRACASSAICRPVEIFERFSWRLLAALQIAVISTGRRPPRKRSLEWCGFLPPYRFNCLWACSFHCQLPRSEIGVTPLRARFAHSATARNSVPSSLHRVAISAYR